MINFYNEDIDFQLDNESEIETWLTASAAEEGFEVSEVSYIFCSDEHLHTMNVKFLDHDTLTDVITFPYNESPIEGDIFISLDRVRDNAQDLGVSMSNELCRVMVHGLLHLVGYEDYTPELKAEMRAKEDYYLKQLFK